MVQPQNYKNLSRQSVVPKVLDLGKSIDRMLKMLHRLIVEMTTVMHAK
ncbi:MAG: hypothetical protein Q8R88_03090 [Desulfoprunum sp.]|nr:hypothetical protein [Desulfoprunum sp.]